MPKFITPPAHFQDSSDIRSQMSTIESAANKLYAKWGVSALVVELQTPTPEDQAGDYGAIWLLTFQFGNGGVWIPPGTGPSAGMFWWRPGIQPVHFSFSAAAPLMPNNWWRSPGESAEEAFNEAFTNSYQNYVLATTGKPADFSQGMPFDFPPPEWTQMPDDPGNPDRTQD